MLRRAGRVIGAFCAVFLILTAAAPPVEAKPLKELIRRAIKALRYKPRPPVRVVRPVAGPACGTGACSLELLGAEVTAAANAAALQTGPAGGAVIFLCVGNSARSQMAEGLARALRPDLEIYSAGSEPKGVNPYAVRVMAEIGIDISSQQSKLVEVIPPDRVGTAITLCADGACPFFPGQLNRAHWPFPDPAAVTGSDQEILAAFRRARDDIRARLEAELETVLTLPKAAEAAPSGNKIAAVTQDTFDDVVVEASRSGTVVVDFHAPW